MNPLKQIYSHNPPHTFGDCDRTCLASLLGAESPDALPHWGIHGDDTDKFLSAKKQALNAVGYDTMELPFDSPLEDVLRCVAHMNPNMYYMLSGKSNNGVNHVVICLNDKIVHDPSIDNCGITGPCDNGLFYVGFLVPSLVNEGRQL